MMNVLIFTKPRILFSFLFFAGMARIAPGATTEADPPHSGNTNGCHSCHIAYHAAGVTNAVPAGNANLCLSCHAPGGTASAGALVDSDQAMPWPGLPTNTAAAGTSHRWDSGVAGHVEFIGGAATNSSGTVQSSGAFTGRYTKAYTITITTAGNSGAARFNWSATAPGGGSGTNVFTGANVVLNEGIKVTFTNGLSAPSFQINDRWQLFVHRDLNLTTNSELLARMTNGMMMCSTCHNQHSQTNAPFGTNAPGYFGPGTGEGRHYQRIADDSGQLCRECHLTRFVTNAAAGSHPVRVNVPVGSFFRIPPTLPLDRTNRVECLTCHRTHSGVTSDGDLLRMTNRTSLCVQCHTLADTASPAAHFNPTNGVLWPGGQYGTTFPQRTDVAQRGTCVNCHQPHGWPDAASPTNDYPGLLVDREENLCFTCHDTNGPAMKNVKDDFGKALHHPVVDTDLLRRGGRSVECTDCHNTHQARTGAYVYTNTATATRNLVISPNRGVAGVAVSYTGLGNFVAPGAGNYTATNSVTYEYQICFKCHSAYAWGTNSPPNGLSANGSVTNPVETDLAQQFNPNNLSGHPIVTGLDNYPNSIPIAGRKGLLAAAMKVPWKANVGQQTMTCIDCHNTDAALPAAQGPHGSAAQFMLRTFGTNAPPSNWPSVTLSKYDSSWCANCHNNLAGPPHTEGNHSNRQCYQCHIVIPHGGRLSRLVADNDTMPARYAYNGVRNNSNLQRFNKKATSGAGGYTEGDCRAGCDGKHSGSTPVENW